MRPRRLLPWIAVGVKIWAYLAAALLLVGAIGYGASVVRKASRVDAAEARAKAAEKGRAQDMAEVVKRLDADAVARKAFLARFDAIDQKFAGIKIPEPGKLIQWKEKPGEPCPAPTLGPEFMGVWNESSKAGSSAPATR